MKSNGDLYEIRLTRYEDTYIEVIHGNYDHITKTGNICKSINTQFNRKDNEFRLNKNYINKIIFKHHYIPYCNIGYNDLNKLDKFSLSIFTNRVTQTHIDSIKNKYSEIIKTMNLKNNKINKQILNREYDHNVDQYKWEWNKYYDFYVCGEVKLND